MPTLVSLLSLSLKSFLFLEFFAIFYLPDQFEEYEAENGEVTAASAPTNSVTDTIAVSAQELKTYILQHSVDSHFLDQFLVRRVMNT